VRTNKSVEVRERVLLKCLLEENIVVGSKYFSR